jgi:hypothetical protein
VRDARLEADTLRAFVSDLVPITAQNDDALAKLESWQAEYDLVKVVE